MDSVTWKCSGIIPKLQVPKRRVTMMTESFPPSFHWFLRSFPNRTNDWDDTYHLKASVGAGSRSGWANHWGGTGLLQQWEREEDMPHRAHDEAHGRVIIISSSVSLITNACLSQVYPFPLITKRHHNPCNHCSGGNPVVHTYPSVTFLNQPIAKYRQFFPKIYIDSVVLW